MGKTDPNWCLEYFGEAAEYIDTIEAENESLRLQVSASRLAAWSEEMEKLRAENRRLREQVAHLSLYKPARRIDQAPEPVNAVGPTNWAFYGMTDDHFVDASKMVAD